MHIRWMARNYRLALTQKEKTQFELKVLAETLFKDKKKSYPMSIGPKFRINRLNEEQKALTKNITNSILTNNEKIEV